MLKVKGVFVALLFLSLFLLPQTDNAQVATSAYLNFESSQTNPVRLSPDGTRLFAVNTPDARLSVFDHASPSSPRLIAEIPVGIEPVSVNPLSNDEVWVVNQESEDSISWRAAIIRPVQMMSMMAAGVFALLIGLVVTLWLSQ